MASMKKTTAMINSIINNIIGELGNYELTTTTTARTSHGRTTSTSTTTLTRKAVVVKEKAPKEPWLVEPEGWTPSVGRRADGMRELWGAPRISKNGEIEVPVKLVDNDIVVMEYKLALTTTVKGNVETCRRMATAALISGRHAYVTQDIMRARKLLSHHKWEKAYENLREEINELFMELNYIAELAISARKAARIDAERDVERLQEELKQARNVSERAKMYARHSHTSDEWIHEICKALAENLGGDADDIRVARNIAERRLREKDNDDDED